MGFPYSDDSQYIVTGAVREKPQLLDKGPGRVSWSPILARDS